MFKIQGTTSWWKHGWFFRHSKTKGFLTLLCICMICVYTNIFTNLPACKIQAWPQISQEFPQKLSLTFTSFHLFCLCCFLMTSFSLKQKNPATSLPLGRYPGAFPLELAVNQGHVGPPHGPTWSLSHPTLLRKFRKFFDKAGCNPWVGRGDFLRDLM